MLLNSLCGLERMPCKVLKTTPGLIKTRGQRDTPRLVLTALERTQALWVMRVMRYFSEVPGVAHLWFPPRPNPQLSWDLGSLMGPLTPDYQSPESLGHPFSLFFSLLFFLFSRFSFLASLLSSPFLFFSFSFPSLSPSPSPEGNKELKCVLLKLRSVWTLAVCDQAAL